jgi:hypothetical protein
MSLTRLRSTRAHEEHAGPRETGVDQAILLQHDDESCGAKETQRHCCCDKRRYGDHAEAQSAARIFFPAIGDPFEHDDLRQTSSLSDLTLNAAPAITLESSIDSRGSTGGFFMSNFRAIDRETGFLLPPSVDEWLPERHLARFVVEVERSEHSLGYASQPS